MPEGELWGKNTGVNELGTTVETPEEKVSLCSLEEGIGNLGRLQGSC